MAEASAPGPEAVFHSASYVQCFAHLGQVRQGSGARAPVHVRQIPGSDLSDGLLPYPYSWLTGDDIAVIAEEHSDLVTLTGVIAPGFDARRHADTSMISAIRPYKSHFIFDPQRPPPSLSRRSRRNVARGLQSWRFGVSTGSDIAESLHGLNTDMVRRRGLSGTVFDAPVTHFADLCRLAETEVFTVRDGAEFGSIAVGVRGPGGLHLLHLLNSEEGLRRDAAAALMSHLVGIFQDRGERLYLGGVPAGAVGIERFKRRWTNMNEATMLVTVVIDRLANEQLARRVASGLTDHFPEYRQPWHLSRHRCVSDPSPSA